MDPLRVFFEWLVWLLRGWTYWLASADAAPEQPHQPPRVHCRECGERLRVVSVSHAPITVLQEHPPAYLDSG